MAEDIFKFVDKKQEGKTTIFLNVRNNSQIGWYGSTLFLGLGFYEDDILPFLDKN